MGLALAPNLPTSMADPELATALFRVSQLNNQTLSCSQRFGVRVGRGWGPVNLEGFGESIYGAFFWNRPRPGAGD
jgi:hypothetical protein